MRTVSPQQNRSHNENLQPLPPLSADPHTNLVKYEKIPNEYGKYFVVAAKVLPSQEE